MSGEAINQYSVRNLPSQIWSRVLLVLKIDQDGGAIGADLGHLAPHFTPLAGDTPSRDSHVGNL